MTSNEVVFANSEGFWVRCTELPDIVGNSRDCKSNLDWCFWALKCPKWRFFGGKKSKIQRFSCPMLSFKYWLSMRYVYFLCIFVFLCLLVSASPIYILLIIKCIYWLNKVYAYTLCFLKTQKHKNTKLRVSECRTSNSFECYAEREQFWRKSKLRVSERNETRFNYRAWAISAKSQNCG